jgi:hypothetical protein
MSMSTRQGEGDGATDRESWGEDLATWSGGEADPGAARPRDPIVEARERDHEVGGDLHDPSGDPVAPEAPDTRGEPPDRSRTAADRPGVMIPARRDRLPFEAPLMRVVATAGIIAIGIAIAAIMASQHSQGWLIGLVVSVVSVVLAGILWSSRRL